MQTILVVDDELGAIEVVATALEDEGFRVLSAANGRVGNHRPSPIFPFSLWNVEELFVKE